MVAQNQVEIGDEVKTFFSRNFSVTIPDGIAAIGEEAFRNCRGLASVTTPAAVTTIGPDAFNRCSGLASVTIPECYHKVYFKMYILLILTS